MRKPKFLYDKVALGFESLDVFSTWTSLQRHVYDLYKIVDDRGLDPLLY